MTHSYPYDSYYIISHDYESSTNKYKHLVVVVYILPLFHYLQYSDLYKFLFRLTSKPVSVVTLATLR